MNTEHCEQAHIFKLNFSRDISKMHYFSTNFQKSPSIEPPACFTLRYWRPEVAWFGTIVVFHSDYDDEIELLKSVMT